MALLVDLAPPPDRRDWGLADELSTGMAYGLQMREN
jgi:hypothetical protein